MAKKKYGHSAYWLAKKEALQEQKPLKLTREFLAGKHRSSLVDLALRMRRPGAALGVWLGILGTLIAVDTGIAVAHLVRDVADPETRKRMKKELMRNLRIVRRPFYYAKEKERRRHLAEERRKVKRRKTLAPMPNPQEILEAWNVRKESREAMLRLGCLLEDLACHVDSALRFDENGDVCGRNGGIRGWLRENLPELLPKYKTLMRYKALAMRMKQIAKIRDPEPAACLMKEPHRTAIAPVLDAFPPVFSRMFADADAILSPDAIFRSLAQMRHRAGLCDALPAPDAVSRSRPPPLQNGLAPAVSQTFDSGENLL